MRDAMRHQIQERVVTIGGGTGSFTMLSELKKPALVDRDNDRLGGIVAQADGRVWPSLTARRSTAGACRPLPQ